MQLREEEDLHPLQGLPRFETLAHESLLSQRQAQVEAQAEVFMQASDEIDPAQESLPLLLALHGNSQNGRKALLSWSAITGHGYQLAAIQSSQIVSAGSYSWKDWMLAQRDFDHFTPGLTATHDPGRMLFGGFSLGAGLAIWQALANTDIRPRGFIGVGTYLPDLDSLLPLLKDRPADKLRGYLIVGDLDDPCYEITLEVASLCEAHNLPCYLEVHKGLVHDFPHDFADTLTRALAFIHAGCER